MQRPANREVVMARFELGSSEMAAVAAIATDGQAYHELGVMYAAGRTVPVDLVVAHKWFNIAVVRATTPPPRAGRKSRPKCRPPTLPPPSAKPAFG